jgi:hypothetical protein
LGLDALFVALHAAYLQARRHKRGTPSQLRFERDLESNLLALASELEQRTYRLRPSSCFICETPVKREIVAADFRDRVVHHLVYDWIAPTFERQFLHDSYSCRKGKGTLFGIRRVEGFLRAASDDMRRDCWVLRLDISGFFMAIDRARLFALVQKGLGVVLVDPGLLDFLLRTLVFADPLAGARFRGSPTDWEGLPSDKSLQGSAPGCGLPIGNLTSQLFANIYLNPLDQFVKRELKLRWYGRYVDDMVFLHPDRAVLAAAIGQVRDFLRDRLGLRLHPCKVHLQPAAHGFPFLGVYVLPFRTYAGRRVVANFRAALRDELQNPNPVPHPNNKLEQARLRSYRGLLAHHNCRKLATVCS